jgi:galactose-1-phosphate uridylyltransferase
MTDPTQLPNVVAANEHLHRQLTAKDARIKELEAENRLLRIENSFIQNDNAALYAQLNGEAA